MYGLAYVILRPNFTSLADELDVTLAPFRCGGEELFPGSALSFEDATSDLKRLHASGFEYKEGALLWDLGAASLSSVLNLARVIEHLDALGFSGFRGTFAEIEPDFDRFVGRFTSFNRRDSRTGCYGRWINPLGRWDWWELGGRFNGAITGERLPASDASGISSGRDVGRDTLYSVAGAFGAAVPETEALIEANIELASTLLVRLDGDEESWLPTAVVLPAGSASNAARWLDSTGWYETGPLIHDVLGTALNAPFRSLIRAAYTKFEGHAVAGVAYHF